LGALDGYFVVNVKKTEFVFTCIFGVSNLTRQCSNINQVRWVKFLTCRSFLNLILKTELKIKIR